MCLFCEIIEKKIPCYKIYEDDMIFCFLDINPCANGHCLIIPKKHVCNFDLIDDETLSYVYSKARNIKSLLEEKLGATGFAITFNNGNLLEVDHFHLHIIPSYDDNFIDAVVDIYNKII